MKICFVSGPRKPSQCGITDYVDLLSKELKLQRVDVVKHSFQDLIDCSHSVNYQKQTFTASNSHPMLLQKMVSLEGT